MKNNTILVVAAHSDDETFGCSGTIAKHALLGDKVHILFMTDGVGSRDTDLKKSIEKRLKSAKKAVKILGIVSMQNLDFPDNAMDSVPLLSVVQAIEKKVFDIRPNIIYTHHFGDLNIDHQLTHTAVMTACRPQPDFSVKEIYSFEVLSSTEWQSPGIEKAFIPNYYVDITNTIKLKFLALNSYHEELRDYPHSRSLEAVEALAKYRGASVGVSAAEAFKVERIIK
jgi:LmbE family N-acetylglucosaminyl deacetylase